MDLRLTASYDATPEEVFAMITDATFHEQVCEAIRARSYDVAVHEAGVDTVVRVQWELPPVHPTGVTTRFVSHRLVVAQTKIWHPAGFDGTREADVEGEVTGAAVRLTGRTRIVPEGRLTTQVVDLQITASAPLRGRRIEQVVAEAVRARMERKFEIAWSWLSGTL